MRALLLCASLLAPGLGAAQALPAAPKIPGDVPVDALWQSFLREARHEDIQKALLTVNALFDEQGNVTVDACTDGRDALQEALVQAPVSIAVWYAEMECAEALGDESALERALGAFAALSRHALARAPEPGSLDPPIPIVNEADAWLLLRALEYEIGYSFYPLPIRGPYLPLLISAYDPQEQREHLLRFDAVDTWRALLVRDTEQLSPAYAVSFRHAFLEQAAKEGEHTPTAALRKRINALEKAPLPQRPAWLAELAAEGDFGAAQALYALCIADEKAECSELAIDALLPFAEYELAQPSWMLAMAHALGRGVKRNPRAADQLFDRADTRLGEHRGSLAAARQWLADFGQTALPVVLAKRLQALAKAGNTAAAEVLLLEQIRSLHNRRPSTRQLSRLQAAATASDLRVRGGYGMLLIEAGDLAGLDLLRHAAGAGEAGSTLALIATLQQHPERTANPDELPKLQRQAGLLGFASGSLSTAIHHEQNRRFELARQWYVSAFMQGEVGAGVAAARLAIQAPGIKPTGAAHSARLLHTVLANRDDREARRLLALLLLRGDESLAAEPERGAALLRENAAKGDSESSLMLASFLLDGTISAQDGEHPEQMLRSQIALDDIDAMDTLAMLIHSRSIAGSADEAFALWRRAAAGGSVRAKNNLAWMLCTSTDPAFHDPALGIKEARLLAAIKDLDYRYRDTVATCHASVGDFAAAVELLGELIGELEALGVDGEELAYFSDKRAQFERGEAFREGPETQDQTDAINAAPEPAEGAPNVSD